MRDIQLPAPREASFLLVDSESHHAAMLKQHLARLGVSIVAEGVTEALRAPEPAAGWCGLIIDVHLADGDGISLLTELREQGNRAPALLVSSKMDADAVNRGFRAGARVIVGKPVSPDDVVAFGYAARTTGGDLTLIAATWARRYGLTPAEARVFEAELEGIPRHAIAELAGVEEGTIKRQARHVLQKSGDARMSDAVLRALREELYGKST